MDIIRFRDVGETISKSNIDKKLETYLRTSKVGFEIEGSAINATSGESDCDECEDYGAYCSECEIPERWSDCPHFRSDDGYCRYYGSSICEMCESRHGCLSENSLMSIFNKISDELGGIPTRKSNFQENKEFLYIYNDGSVNTELVTGALRVTQIGNVFRKALELLEKYGVEVSPIVHAGGHQTVSHEDYFPSIVAKNAIQINRYYLPSLLTLACVEGSERRDSDYRSCPRSPAYGNGNERIPHWTKNASINFKDTAATVQTSYKLIEFRYPDSHKNVNQVILSAIINMATIAKAFTMSDEGVAIFPQKHFNIVKSEVNEFYCDGRFRDLDRIKKETRGLIYFLEDEISNYANLDSVRRAVDDITSHKIMENGMDIGEIKLK